MPSLDLANARIRELELEAAALVGVAVEQVAHRRRVERPEQRQQFGELIKKRWEEKSARHK